MAASDIHCDDCVDSTKNSGGVPDAERMIMVFSGNMSGLSSTLTSLARHGYELTVDEEKEADVVLGRLQSMNW